MEAAANEAPTRHLRSAVEELVPREAHILETAGSSPARAMDQRDLAPALARSAGGLAGRWPLRRKGLQR